MKIKKSLTWLQAKFKSIKLYKFSKATSSKSSIKLHFKLSTFNAFMPFNESVGIDVRRFIDIDNSCITDSSPLNASRCNARILLLSKISFLMRKFLKAFRPILVYILVIHLCDISVIL